MSRFLRLPLECRLRIYDFYLQGIDSQFIIHYFDYDERTDGPYTSYSTSFQFEQRKGVGSYQTVRRVSLSMLKVCPQTRRELFPLLGTAEPVFVEFSMRSRGDGLPVNGVNILDNGYAYMVREFRSCTCLTLCRVPLKRFPFVKRVFLQCCLRQYIKCNESDGRWSMVILRDKAKMAKVRKQAIEIDTRNKESFGFRTADPDCLLEIEIKFGIFEAHIITPLAEVQTLDKRARGPVLVSLSQPWVSNIV